MRETVDPEFAAYVDARQAGWLRTASLVYGEPAQAEERLLHAFTRLALRWPRVDDPDVLVLRALCRPAMSRWPRRRGSGPVEAGDDESVGAALAGLTPDQRAVLVLLYYEELTPFEVSDVLGLSAAAVRSRREAALNRLRDGLGRGERPGDPRARE